MVEAKIEIAMGPLSFKGEGGEKWLTAQLDKLLEHASKNTTLTVTPRQNGTAAGANGEEVSGVTLAKYLQSKNAGANQVRRFLAAADWLQSRGNKRLSTAQVTKALKDNQQGKLSNPADCLNKNVKKGYCEKDGNEFFVTPDGRSSLNE